MVPAALLCKGWKRALALGALFVYAAAELIQFQPNPYDNNKLFYVAFLLMLPLVGSYLVALWNRLRGLPGRALLAAVFFFLSLTSGVLVAGARGGVGLSALFRRAKWRQRTTSATNCPRTPST